jgi:cytochrome oxidase Cu insertion factor (SCO1/SenC/PrrC family)
MANKQYKQDRREAARRAASRRHRSRLVSLVAVIVLGIGALVALSAGSGNQAAALAPDFELETNSGETVSLSDYRGQPVAVTFMHTY